MEIDPNIISQIQSQLQSSPEVIIISHRNPDPDTIGSNLALKIYLQSIGKKTRSVCIDPIPRTCHFMKESEQFVNELPNLKQLVIAVDASSPEQLGFPNCLERLSGCQIIVIDHHTTNKGYGNINLIRPDAASTTIIIFSLLKKLGARISPDMATALLCGLYADTGSFMHSNTDPTALINASELVKYGANRNLIINNLYKNKPVEQLYLWGKIFSEAVLTRKNIIVSALKHNDFKSINADHQLIGGVMDYLNTVKGSQITALLTEDQNGNIKGSLRTKSENMDLTRVAKDLGGGGHPKASGFTIPGRLKKETRWKILPS